MSDHHGHGHRFPLSLVPTIMLVVVPRRHGDSDPSAVGTLNPQKRDVLDAGLRVLRYRHTTADVRAGVPFCVGCNWKAQQVRIVSEPHDLSHRPVGHDLPRPRPLFETPRQLVQHVLRFCFQRNRLCGAGFGKDVTDAPSGISLDLLKQQRPVAFRTKGAHFGQRIYLFVNAENLLPRFRQKSSKIVLRGRLLGFEKRTPLCLPMPSPSGLFSAWLLG